jgi:hypothetical protein
MGIAPSGLTKIPSQRQRRDSIGAWGNAPGDGGFRKGFRPATSLAEADGGAGWLVAFPSNTYNSRPPTKPNKEDRIMRMLLGNLPSEATEADITQLLAEHGVTVVEAKIEPLGEGRICEIYLNNVGRVTAELIAHRFNGLFWHGKHLTADVPLYAQPPSP